MSNLKTAEERTPTYPYPRVLVSLGGKDDEERLAKAARIRELAEEAGFVFAGRGNVSGFINFLIEEGQIKSVKDLDADSDKEIFVCVLPSS